LPLKIADTSKIPVSPEYLSTVANKYVMVTYSNPRTYSSLSRYSARRIIIDDLTHTEYHETDNDVSIVSSSSDNYYTVDASTEDRLDVIANNYYGRASYWWIIALANKIIDPFTISIGTTLRIPPVSSLYESDGVISI
jgi:nucleoid-associated protein YgaU